MQCTAKSKQSGKQCKRQAVPGMTVCYMHGGATPTGVASPHFKHGRYSKYLPSQLLEKYKDASQDADLLALRDEISLIDVRIRELVEKIPQGGATHSWIDLRAAWGELLSAQRNNDETKMRLAFLKVGDIIRNGAEEAAVWQSIEQSLETRRRLTSAEAKRLTDMNQVITAEKAIALVYAVLDAVKTPILEYESKGMPADKTLLSVIGKQVRKLVSLD